MKVFNETFYSDMEIAALVKFAVDFVKHRYRFNTRIPLDIHDVGKSFGWRWHRQAWLKLGRIQIEIAPQEYLSFPIFWNGLQFNDWREIFLALLTCGLFCQVQQDNSKRFNRQHRYEMCHRVLERYRVATLDMDLLAEKAGYA